MDQVLEAFTTGAGMLWKALWALIFGYIISACIQVLVTQEQMAKICPTSAPMRQTWLN